MSEEEVKDPQGLLKAYRELQENVTTLRTENKQLKSQVESLDESAVSQWKERAIRAEAKANLTDQGIKNPDRILKYLKFEGVEVDDEGNLSGLDTRIEEVKTDFPELFDARRRAGRNSADIHADTPAAASKSTTEKQVDALFG